MKFILVIFVNKWANFTKDPRDQSCKDIRQILFINLSHVSLDQELSKIWVDSKVFINQLEHIVDDEWIYMLTTMLKDLAHSVDVPFLARSKSFTERSDLLDKLFLEVSVSSLLQMD